MSRVRSGRPRPPRELLFAGLLALLVLAMASPGGGPLARPVVTRAPVGLAAAIGRTSRSDPGASGSAQPAGVTATADPNPADVRTVVFFSTFDSECTLGCSYAWTFDDGTAAAKTQYANHSFTRAGAYSITSWVNATLGDVNSDTFTLTVDPGLSVNVTGTSHQEDEGIPVTFSASVSGGTSPFTTVWRLADGTTSPSLSLTHAFDFTGNAVNEFWANDSGGGSKEAWFNLTLHPQPLVFANATPTSLQAGEVGNFSAQAHGGTAPIAFAWAFGDGSFASGANVTHAFLSGGTAEARVWANDSVGGSNSTWVQVPVTPGLAAIPVEVSNVSEVGLVEHFRGEAQGGSPPYTFHWTFQDGTFASTQNASTEFSAAGTYRVTFWVNDSDAERAHGSLEVSVLPAPSVDPSAVPGTVDATEGVQFSSGASGGDPPLQYTWHFGDGGVSHAASPVHAFNVSGTYAPRVWANDSSDLSATEAITVSVAPWPHVMVTASRPSVDAGETDGFNGTCSGGVGGPAPPDWAFGTGFFSHGTEVNYSFPQSGTYTVRAWCNDTTGASAQGSLSVDVAPALLASPWSNLSTLHVGGSVWVVGNFSGGTGPFRYFWGLGDSQSSERELNVTFPTAGTFTLRFWVNDSVGESAEGLVSVTVETLPSSPAPGGSNGNSHGGSVLWEWAVLGGILVAGVLVGLLLYLRRSRRPAEEAVVPATPAVDGSFLPPELPDYTGEGGDLPPWPLAPLTIFEGADPEILYRTTIRAEIPPPRVLVFSLEPPTDFHEVVLLRGAAYWRVSRIEGDRHVAPGDVDRIGNLSERHFKSGPGGVVLITCLRTILTASSLRTTARLLQVLQEEARDNQGRLLVFLDPRDVTLPERRALTEGAERVRIGPRPPSPSGDTAAPAPSADAPT